MSSQLSAPTGGHDSRAASLVVVTWTLTGLALIIVGLRIFGRYRLARNAGRDDVFILIAMVSIYVQAKLITRHFPSG